MLQPLSIQIKGTEDDFLCKCQSDVFSAHRHFELKNRNLSLRR